MAENLKTLYETADDCFGKMPDLTEPECVKCHNLEACQAWKAAGGDPAGKVEKPAKVKKGGKKPVEEPKQEEPEVITEREEMTPEPGPEPEVITEREDAPEVVAEPAKEPAKGKGKQAKAPAKPEKKAPAKPAKKEAAKKASAKKADVKKEAPKSVEKPAKKGSEGKAKGKKEKPAQKANVKAEKPKKVTERKPVDEHGFRIGTKTARYFALLQEGTHTADDIIKITSKEFKCPMLNNYGTFKVFLSHLQSVPEEGGNKKYSASRGIKVHQDESGVLSLRK